MKNVYNYPEVRERLDFFHKALGNKFCEGDVFPISNYIQRYDKPDMVREYLVLTMLNQIVKQSSIEYKNKKAQNLFKKSNS